MSRDRDNPPSNWCTWWPGLTRLTDDIFYGWPDLVEGDTNPYFYHWCPTAGRWTGQSTADHLVVEPEPLHMTPSLLWPCCDTHGWVRNGKWFPA